MFKDFVNAFDGRLIHLLLLQFRGRMRRSFKRVTSRRRLIPTILVGIFLALYAVQIYIAISFNPTEASVDIGAVAPVGMLGILFIKLLGVCIDRKKSGAGFRDVEVHRLLGGPFSPQQVRAFRFLGHAVSIFFTSLFAAIFFRFHVTSFAAALAGAYLAMLFTYLAYGLVAVVAVNVRESTYKRCRMLGCAALVALLGYCLMRVWQRDVSNVDFLHALGAEVLALSQTPFGYALTAPFQAFTNVVVADNLLAGFGWAAVSCLINLIALQQLLYWEARLQRQAWERERVDFQDRQLADAATHGKAKSPRLVTSKAIPWLGGAGPIVWRQLKSVIRLRSGLSWLLLPLGGALALGCYAAYDPEEGALMTIAVTVMLSSVFLPGLLPFDFRGDLQALAALKMMPIRPFYVVAGQLTMPILLLAAFQFMALSTLVLHDRSLLGTVLLTMCFLLPTNTIILALENLIFLLYPFRLAEFDMQATVRRIVMLMAKFCVVFFAVLIAILAGLSVLGLKLATQWVPALSETYVNVHAPILVTTQLAALSGVAYVTVWATCWAYRRFDLNEDLPI